MAWLFLMTTKKTLTMPTADCHRCCFFPGNLPVMEDNLPVMSLWRFTGNLPVGKLPVNITN